LIFFFYCSPTLDVNSNILNSHTHRSPDFVLHSVGRHGDKPGASFWRDYSLIIPDVLDCFIRETFVKDLFQEFDGDIKNGTIWYNKD
jgi:hypothetical protein